MRVAVTVACVVAVGCGSHHEPSTQRVSRALPERCTLRITPRGTFVDGEPMSRPHAVARCKRTTGGAIVVIEDSAARHRDATTGAIVVVEDNVTKAEWNKTRSALEREGVRIYVRGELCYQHGRFGCRPKLPPERREPGITMRPVKPPATTAEPAWTPPAVHTPTPPTKAASNEQKPARCSIRVTERGILVDGDPMTREQAVALCKQRSTALVELADGAKEAEWSELRALLVAAGVTILMRGVRGHQECLDNPLAKGCN